MDKDRRKFLKILLIGGGTILLGKVLSPLFSGLFDHSVDKNQKSLPSKSISENFRIVEDKKVLSIYDNSGEEIFQIDKGV